jgi:hypothetical protein
MRVRPELSRGKTRRHSRFALGLRLFRRAQELFGKILHAFNFVFIYHDPFLVCRQRDGKSCSNQTP